MGGSRDVNGETVFKLSDDVSLQDLGADEGGVILQIATGELYTVNDTAVAFLARLDGAASVRDVADRVAAEFNVPLGTALADLVELAAELESESLLVRLGG